MNDHGPHVHAAPSDATVAQMERQYRAYQRKQQVKTLGTYAFAGLLGYAIARVLR